MSQVLFAEPALPKSPTQQSGAKSNRVCRHFTRGRCTWGAACRFSHEPEPQLPQQGQQQQQQGSQITVQAKSGNTGNNGGGNNTPTTPNSPHAWIGVQQLQLQQQRNAILKAAMDGQFAVRPVVGADGQSRHMIHLTTIPSPEIAIQLLGEPNLKAQLQLLEHDDRVREGGLHYLIGEPSVFWSMIRHFHQTGSTTSAKWDALILRARQLGRVECMFYRSAAGCLSIGCNFDHISKAANTMGGAPVMSMATSNAMLGRVPSLGFGISIGSADKLDSNNNGQSSMHTIASSQDLSSATPSPPHSSDWMQRDDDQLLKGIWGGLTISEPPLQQQRNIW